MKKLSCFNLAVIDTLVVFFYVFYEQCPSAFSTVHRGNANSLVSWVHFRVCSQNIPIPTTYPRYLQNHTVQNCTQTVSNCMMISVYISPMKLTPWSSLSATWQGRKAVSPDWAVMTLLIFGYIVLVSFKSHRRPEMNTNVHVSIAYSHYNATIKLVG